MAQSSDSQAPADLTPDIPPSAPVITISGFCPDAPAGTDTKSAACKTVITKAAFEKLADTLSPKMPTPARQNLANDYAKMLVLSVEAKKRGVEQTERYKDLMRFVSMRLAAEELFHILQEESKPSDAEVQKYYQEHADNYEEISLKRLFIPRNRADAKAEDKMPTDEDVLADGQKAKARLAAGEDFDKVQKEIYTEKAYNTPPPPTSVPNWRRENMPVTQKALFGLNPGDFSNVIVEAAGAYIYRVEKKEMAPLASVRAGIESELANQKLKTTMESLTSSTKPELNEAYFHAGMGTPGNHTVGPAATPEGQKHAPPGEPSPSAPDSSTSNR